MFRYMCLISLLNNMDTDENVLTFAMEHGLIYEKHSCPTCEEHIDLSSRITVDGAVWRCHKGGYRKSITLRLGLVLVRSKMPLKIFILYLYF